MEDHSCLSWDYLSLYTGPISTGVCGEHRDLCVSAVYLCVCVEMLTCSCTDSSPLPKTGRVISHLYQHQGGPQRALACSLPGPPNSIPARDNGGPFLPCDRQNTTNCPWETLRLTWCHSLSLSPLHTVWKCKYSISKKRNTGRSPAPAPAPWVCIFLC